jgi:hypothetical protein
MFYKAFKFKSGLSVHALFAAFLKIKIKTDFLSAFFA